MKNYIAIIAMTMLLYTNAQNHRSSVDPTSTSMNGQNNTATGYFTLYYNNTGAGNTATGIYSLYNNNSGSYNTTIGYHSLTSNISGSYNTANGYQSLYYNNMGSYNTSIGSQALFYNHNGTHNTAVGYQALFNVQPGSYNSAYGPFALWNLYNGYYNTANGNKALFNIQTGNFNTATGNEALMNLTNGSENTANGNKALFNIQTGNFNTATGNEALMNLTNGSENTGLGSGAQTSGVNAHNQTIIGSNAVGQADNSVVLGNENVTAIYMGQDSGAIVYAGGLNIDGMAITSSELNLLSGITTIGSGIVSTVTENDNIGVRLSTSSTENHGNIGSNAVDLSFSNSSSETKGATGDNSFASGLNTTASGNVSSAIGINTIASDYSSFAIGQYNNSLSSITTNGNATAFDLNNTAFVIGNGTASDAKSDAFKVLFSGDATIGKDLTIKGDILVSSDARLKANIVSLGSTLAKLLLIDGKTYTMKKDGKQKIGLLAQDIKNVFPELVSEDDHEMLTVNYQGLIPVLINALKEQDAKISRLEQLTKKLIADE